MKDYDGTESTAKCGGRTKTGKPCTRKVTFSVVEPYDEPLVDLTPYCDTHRDQEPKAKKHVENPKFEGWSKEPSF